MMNRKLLAAAVAGVIAPMTAQALDVSVSGRVNRLIRFADNGAGSDVQHLDHTASRSRFTFTAEGEVMGGINAGAYLEAGFASNRGWQHDIDQPDDGASTNRDFRFSNLYFSGAFGKVTMGHAAPAGNGQMFSSHNGAWAGTENGVDSNSSISVHYSELMEGEDDTDSGLNVNSFYGFGAISPGRANILRYDTPSIGPIALAMSVRKDGADDHRWEFGGSLSHDVGGSSVIGGMSFSDDALGLSGGIAFPQGTSVNVAWGFDDTPNAMGVDRDYEHVYANVAHSWGDTSVAIQYQSAETGRSDRDSQNIGLGVSQSLGSGVQIYAGFNNYTFDDATNRNLDDVNSLHVGSMVRFN